MPNKIDSLPRRKILAGSIAALTSVGMAGLARDAVAAGDAAPAPVAAAGAPRTLPSYASWKDSSSVVVHSSTTIETRRSAYGASVITPSEQVFVRNNLPPPDAAILNDRNAWEISIEGVKNPQVLSLAELKAIGLEAVTTVLQCSGNGRAYFASKPSGTKWTVGAAGCVVWSGVPVRAVAEALGGIDKGMRFMTGTGGEKLPEGLDPKSVVVERSVPKEAMADALLAWEMNGQPLSLAHGGPLRLIVPGYFGVNNTKYIKRLAFTAVETDAHIMSHGYRMSPPGSKGDPSQASVQAMNVKSWINSPNGEGEPVKAGNLQIHGVAFGGLNAVKRVEVSLDGGKTWKAARFIGPDLGKYAWRQFAFEARLPPGTYTLASRAIDTAGTVQPQERVENAGGYSNNSWADHAVTITVA